MVTELLTEADTEATLTVVGAIGVLGPLLVDGDAGVLPPRERTVLAVLVVRRGEVVSADTMADAWWGENLPATWAKAMQGCVVQLRKALGADAIRTTGQGYCLMVPADEIDAYRFERLVVRGQELLTLGEVDRAAYLLDEALGVWRGTHALADLDGWEPGRIERTRLQELRLDAEESRLDAALRAGRYRQVLSEAQARVAEAPLREHRWTLLALAQYQAGRQGDALRTLRRARRVLADELGLDPFHGDADDVVDPAGSIEPMTNLMSCPSPQDAWLTVYPDVDHDSWTQTYNLSAGHDIYTWMLDFALP